MSSSLMPVSSRTSLISVWISLSPFSLWPCGKPQKPRLFLKSRNSEDALSSNEFWDLITAPMDCSRATLYRHQKPMAIIILFFSLKVLISFTKLNSEGRSSSPVGYGIGIAEVVGSNPTRSTIIFGTPTGFHPRSQFCYSPTRQEMPLQYSLICPTDCPTNDVKFTSRVRQKHALSVAAQTKKRRRIRHVVNFHIIKHGN